MPKNLKLAFIIPTKGRYQNLKILLDSIEKQTLKPELIVILDSNRKYSEDKIKIYSFPVKYIHTGPNSLTEARNIGVRNIPQDFELIGFLDDDVMLYKDAIEIMFDFWQNASKDIGGVAFNIINNRKPRKFWFLKKIFSLGDQYPGNVLLSGYQTMLDKVKKNTYTKWLPGGVTVWRKNIFDEFKFDENIKGYGYIEDLDFSYRVGKKYKLVSLAEAKLTHTPHPVSKEENVNFGISEIVNRFYFIKRHREFLKILFYWASFGKLLENIVFGISTFNSDYLRRALGNIVGITKVIFYGKECKCRIK